MWTIATITSAIYWLGFFIAYKKFRPKDDSWFGWTCDAGLSMVWFITLPISIIRFLKRNKK